MYLILRVVILGTSSNWLMITQSFMTLSSLRITVVLIMMRVVVVVTVVAEILHHQAINFKCKHPHRQAMHKIPIKCQVTILLGSLIQMMKRALVLAVPKVLMNGAGVQRNISLFVFL